MSQLQMSFHCLAQAMDCRNLCYQNYSDTECTGDTGEGIRAWLKLALGAEFSFPHIRIIYPTAPVR
jgi:hypothetical protein